jgi:Septum formation
VTTTLTLRIIAISLLAVTLTGCSIVSDAFGEGETGVFSLAVGDCLDDGGTQSEVSTLPVVDCAELHDSEIYASVLMEGDEYPGTEATVEFADSACYDEFEAFVGIPQDESIYGYGTLYPTVDSWAGGDREVLCRIVLGDTDGNPVRIEGSLRGANE